MYRLNRSNIARKLNMLAQACLLSALILMSVSVSSAAENKQIKIELFSLDRSVAYLGEEISASVTVSAQPALRNKALRLRYYLDENELGSQTITEFDASGNASTVFGFKDAPEGRFLFRIVLDIEGENINSDEVSRQLAVLSLPGGMTEVQPPDIDAEQPLVEETAAGMPDLEPEAITFSIASPRLGEEIRIKSRISNVGDVQADNVKIRMFINGQPYGDDVTMNIAAGTTAEIETNFKPASEGKKDILVLINPEGEIDEKSNRNNLLSKILVVRPAEKSIKPVVVAEAPEINKSIDGLANLVIFIETISGVHYTTNGEVLFYISNNSQTVRTKPFTMGAQLMQGAPGKVWLVRQPVKALSPGETITLGIKWPENQFSTSNLYIATADIDGVIDETDVRDNHTRPFRVVSTATSLTGPGQSDQPTEITIIRPRQDERLADNRELEINWKSSADIDKRVRISVHNSKTKEKILSAVTSNDGEFSIDFSLQQAGEYILSISPENSTDPTATKSFHIPAREPVQPVPPVRPVRLVSPNRGTSYRGDQQVNVAWPESMTKIAGLQLDLVLQENGNKKALKLNVEPVNAVNGEFSWQVPDDGSVFGLYSLQARSLDGRVLAITDEIELLPNFVSFEEPEADLDKEDIKADLEIIRTGFNGKDLEFLVMNNGPADISPSALLGYKFTSYFVRKLPISTKEDLVICNSTLLAELPQGEGQMISLGRDPDCPLGEHHAGAKFIYVVNRFTLPKLISQRVIDPKPFNNTSKFYWPD